MTKSLFALAILLVAIGSGYRALAQDWPQWMGEQRDGVYHGNGLVDRIPEQGLPVLWRTTISGGYSGPAVADGRVFVTDYVSQNSELKNNPGARDEHDGTERTLCLDFSSGEILWKVEYPRHYSISYAAGPRATPTVDGDRVYALGAEGDLLCMTVASGEILWKKQLADEFKSQTPLWGHSAHPLVHGDLLYCLAGGPGSVVVAFNKRTGEKVWQALTASEIGYCPPSIAKIAGREQLLIWHADALCGLDLTSGQTLWEYPIKPRYAMSIGAPRVQGDRLFVSGIGDTAAMLEFDSAGKPDKTLWTGTPRSALYSGNATALWVGDVIYGADCQTGQFIAVDPESGERLWETFALTTGGSRRVSHGTAFLIQNDWRSLLFTENGDLILAKFSKKGFEELGKMKVLDPTGECFGRPVVWSHPALANGHLVARNDKEIVCVDLTSTKNANNR